MRTMLARTSTVALLAAGALTVPAVAQASPCDGSAVRTTTSSNTGTPQELGSSQWVANATTSPANQSLTAASQSSVGGSVSVSGTVSADFAIAQASATVGATWTYDVTTSTSSTLTITIQPGEQGRVVLQNIPTTTVVSQYQETRACELGNKIGSAIVHGSDVRTLAETVPL